VPAVVWAVTAFFAVLLTCWSFLAPTYRAPDEPMHVSTVLRLERGGGYPPPGVPLVEADVLSSLLVAGMPFEDGSFQLVPLRRQDAPPREQRPSFADLGPPPPLERVDQMTQHPPLYYLLGAGLLSLVPDGVPFFVEVHVLRLLGVLLTCCLPLCAFLATRRVLGRQAPAVAASLVPVAIPMVSHIGSVASNDTLLMGLFGLVTVAVAHVATGDVSRRTAAVAGALVALTLLTKGPGLVALVWVGLAYGLTALRRRDVRAVLAPAAVFGAVSALGAWWWAVNLLRHGALQPAGFFRTPAEEEPVTDVLHFVAEYGRHLTATFWASFGWQEVTVAPVLTATASVVLLGLVLLGVGATRDRRGVAVLLLVPAVLLAVVVAQVSWGVYGDIGLVRGVQGRYLFPAVVAMAVVAMAGLSRLLGRREPLQPLLLLGTALGAQAVGMHRAVLGFWAPAGDGLAGSFQVMLLWGPWPPSVQVGALVVALAGAAGLVVLLVRSFRASRRDEDRHARLG
jgi:small subunit ribosomal protein S36